jgi:Flp pilus assembly protein TadG
MIEFGWAFAQNLDVKHTAREAGRLAAVDSTTAEIEGRVCNNDLLNSALVTAITRTGGDDAGETAELTVSADLQQITGLFSWVLGGTTLSSTVEFRLEQDADNWDGSNLAPCP